MDQALVPSASDILCESCGYTLNGLPQSGNCPECGMPIAHSTSANPRTLPAWEAGHDHAMRRFVSTAMRALSPGAFYRTLSIRGDVRRTRTFARVMSIPLVLLSAATILVHQLIAVAYGATPPLLSGWPLVASVLIAAAAAWWFLCWAVGRLTALEARYWGFRLPHEVVRRALHYLSVQALVATLLPFAVVTAMFALLAWNRDYAAYMTEYLYAFSGSVIITAVYLFRVYWTAMRSLLYANR